MNSTIFANVASNVATSCSLKGNLNCIEEVSPEKGLCQDP
jgi:hypothetical protein